MLKHSENNSRESHNLSTAGKLLAGKSPQVDRKKYQQLRVASENERIPPVDSIISLTESRKHLDWTTRLQQSSYVSNSRSVTARCSFTPKWTSQIHKYFIYTHTLIPISTYRGFQGLSFLFSFQITNFNDVVREVQEVMLYTSSHFPPCTIKVVSWNNTEKGISLNPRQS